MNPDQFNKRNILKITLSIFLFFSIIESSLAQQKVIDSLHARIQQLETRENFIATDTNYIKLMYDLAANYLYLNKDSTYTIANKALSLSKAINYDKGIAGSKLALGRAKLFDGNFDPGFNELEEVIEIAEKLKLDTLLLKSLNSLGMGYFMKTDYPKGYEISQIGRKKAEALKNYEMSVTFNMNIATTFAILNDSEQALPYYEKALKLIKGKNDKIGLARVKSNMGYLFIKTGELDKARTYLKEASNIFQEKSDIPWLAFTKINLGELAIIERKYDSAISIFKESKKLLKNTYDPQRKAETCLGLSEAYLLKNNLKKSEENALRADSISKATNFYEGLIRANDILYRINKFKNEPKKAMAYLEVSKHLADSIEIAENRTKFLMLETQNNFRKEQFKIEEENERKLERQRIITYFAIILLITSGLILFLIRRNIQTQKRANKELLKINNIKDKVFSIVGHDLKTPISTLQELLELYRNDAISAAEIADMTPRLKNNVDHSAFTLNNLLLWAENQMQGVKTSPMHINLKATATEIVALYQQQIEQKEIIINCQTPKSLTTFIDHEHLNIILRNIILNAIKYSRKKGTINFYGKEKENTIIFSVCDNGIGMSKKLIDNLLQNNNSSSKPGTLNEKGTGLGLNICNDLLIANNGSLAIESELENGSCFHIELPK